MSQTEISDLPWRMLTVEDVAAMLQVSRPMVFIYMQEGLPGHHLSPKVLRFDPDEVITWAKSRCIRQTPGDGNAA